MPIPLQNILKDRDILEGLLEHFSGINELIFNLKKRFHIEQYLSENEIILENFKLEDWERLFSTYIKKTDGQIPKKFLEDPMAHLVYATKEKIKAFPKGDICRTPMYKANKCEIVLIQM